MGDLAKKKCVPIPSGLGLKRDSFRQVSLVYEESPFFRKEFFKVTLWTHKINGLSENDFIMADKCDLCFEKRAKAA